MAVFTISHASYIPTVQILQGPSSKTSLFGPDGSKLAATAPGGTVITDPKAAAAGLAPVGPAILPAAKPELTIGGPAGYIKTAYTLGGPALAPAAPLLIVGPAPAHAPAPAPAVYVPILGGGDDSGEYYGGDDGDDGDDGSYKGEGGWGGGWGGDDGSYKGEGGWGGGWGGDDGDDGSYKGEGGWGGGWGGDDGDDGSYKGEGKY